MLAMSSGGFAEFCSYHLAMTWAGLPLPGYFLYCLYWFHPSQNENRVPRSVCATSAIPVGYVVFIALLLQTGFMKAS